MMFAEINHFGIVTAMTEFEKMTPESKFAYHESDEYKERYGNLSIFTLKAQGILTLDSTALTVVIDENELSSLKDSSTVKSARFFCLGMAI
ncbi:MAG: hypothetical protein GY928_00010 [Colwellia sp.]|nr:hypothetical protein [Colwellia sp.]